MLPQNVVHSEIAYKNFASSLGLIYTREITKEIAEKMRKYTILDYSQIYQMKVSYDQMFINLVKKTLPKKYHFLLCPGFYEYLCGTSDTSELTRKTELFLYEKKYEWITFRNHPEDLEYIKQK